MYQVPRSGQETAAQAAGKAEVEAAVGRCIEMAAADGEEVAVAGDLQAQTMEAAEAHGGAGAELNERDEWLALLMAQHGLYSMCGVAPTYAARGSGGAEVRTAIDHWLVSEGLAWRTQGEVGAGADGLVMGADEGTAGKGHNAGVVRNNTVSGTPRPRAWLRMPSATRCEHLCAPSVPLALEPCLLNPVLRSLRVVAR